MTSLSEKIMKANIRPIPKGEILKAFTKRNYPLEEFKKLWGIYKDVFLETPIEPENSKRHFPPDPKECFVPLNKPRENQRQNQQQERPIQRKKIIIPKSPFTASGFSDDPTTRVWYYVDENDQVQGPFTSLEMDHWFDSGFFFNELLIRFKEQNDFVKLIHLFGKTESQPVQNTNNFRRNANNQQGTDQQSTGGFQRGGQSNLMDRAKKTSSSKEEPSNTKSQTPVEQKSNGTSEGTFNFRNKEEKTPVVEAQKESNNAKEQPKEEEQKPKKVAPKQEEVKEVKEPEQPKKEEEKPAQPEQKKANAAEEILEQIKKPKDDAPIDDDTNWVATMKVKPKKKKKNQNKEPEPINYTIPPEQINKTEQPKPKTVAEIEAEAKKQQQQQSAQQTQAKAPEPWVKKTAEQKPKIQPGEQPQLEEFPSLGEVSTGGPSPSKKKQTAPATNSKKQEEEKVQEKEPAKSNHNNHATTNGGSQQKASNNKKPAESEFFPSLSEANKSEPPKQQLPPKKKGANKKGAFVPYSDPAKANMNANWSDIQKNQAVSISSGSGTPASNNAAANNKSKAKPAAFNNDDFPSL